MPKILIFEQDNTGSVTLNLNTVFIPGPAKPKTKMDDYNCIQIAANSNVDSYFGDYENGKLVEGSLPDVENSRGIKSSYSLTKDLVRMGYDVVYMWVDGEDLSQIDWSFLQDKNGYDVKFITLGEYLATKVIKNTLDNDAWRNQKYFYDFSIVNKLLKICEDRKDCSVLVDLDYYTTYVETIKKADYTRNLVDIIKGNELISDLKSYLNENLITPIPEDLNMQNLDTESSSRAYLLVSNGVSANTKIPASYIYLSNYKSSNFTTTSWSPIAGVNRGLSSITPELEISKYILDTSIISDDAGVSFNGICKIRAYGDTIWGDRTLIKQGDKGVKATSYFSLRNLISDLAKTAYNSAIRYTYESNNEITWMNFKVLIVNLLDKMVSSGVLQSYKIRRATESQASLNTLNSMIAVITLYPNLPVENFEVSINLENAETTVSPEA